MGILDSLGKSIGESGTGTAGQPPAQPPPIVIPPTRTFEIREDGSVLEIIHAHMVQFHDGGWVSFLKFYLDDKTPSGKIVAAYCASPGMNFQLVDDEDA